MLNEQEDLIDVTETFPFAPVQNGAALAQLRRGAGREDSEAAVEFVAP